MPDSLSNSITDAPAPRFRFGVGGMMVFILGVAVALTVAGPGNSDIPTTILSAVAFWFALGLLNQARDLWATFRGRGDLVSDERWGWRYAAAWRVALACILLGHLVAAYAVRVEILVLPEPDDPHLFGAIMFESAVLLVAMTTCLVSTFPSTKTRATRPRWRRIIDLVVLALLGYIAFRVWSDEMLVFVLVHVATVGIEQSEPLAYGIEGIDIDVVARTMRLFWFALTAGSTAVVNLFVIRQIACHWSRGWRWRLSLLAVYAICVAPSSTFISWAHDRGFRGVSPFLAQELTAAPWDMWAIAGILVGMLVTVATYRLVQVRDPSSLAAESDWRVHSARYYHEQVGTAILMVASCIWMFVGYLNASRMLGIEAIGYFFIMPYGYFFLAAFLPALARCIAALRRKWEPPTASIPRIDPCQFAVVWTALLLTIVLAVPAIAALSFCVWLIPFDVFPRY